MPIPTTWAALFRATYDAWGKQTVTQNTIGFHRGYTGHEHLPEFGLIDMNGRMYDPLLGRFLSPDNYVQLPDFSQNFNRYSYCLNNPLIYTDPSGELIGELIYIAAMAYFGGVQANFMHAANNGGNPFNPGNWNWKSPWTYIGMASSGLGAYSQIGGLNGFATETSSLSNLFELPKDPVLLAYANDGGPGKVRLLQNGVLEAKYSLGTVYVYGRDLSKVAAITQKIHQGHTAFLNHPVTQFALAVLPIVPAVGGIRTVSIASKAARPVAQLAAKGVTQYSDDLVKAAQKLYPKKAGITELHHIAPKYLGGAKNGALVPLDGAYHQVITNEFRSIRGYGLGPLDESQMLKIMKDVYSRYPLPPGFGF